MTVHELIEALADLPGGLPVFRYCDWEVEEVNVASSPEGAPDEVGKDQTCVTLY